MNIKEKNLLLEKLEEFKVEWKNFWTIKNALNSKKEPMINFLLEWEKIFSINLDEKYNWPDEDYNYLKMNLCFAPWIKEKFCNYWGKRKRWFVPREKWGNKTKEIIKLFKTNR